MKKNNIAIIPARFGSVRIKNKNIKSFLGKPIIAYPIIACLKSKLFARVIVSTNNKKISDISKKYGAEVLLRDKKFLSNNQTPVGDVIKDLVKKFKKDSKKKILENLPNKELGNIKNIALAVKFLMENDFVNGSVIKLDGGAD